MRRRVQTLEGQGMNSRIPYDRTDPMVDVAAPQPGGPLQPDQGGPPQGAPDQGLGLLGSIGAGATQQPGTGFDPGSLIQGGQSGLPPGLDTDQLTGADLGAMGGMDQDAETAQLEQMMQALEDPNTPPDQKQMIESQIVMAAKRRLAGGLGA